MKFPIDIISSDTLLKNRDKAKRLYWQVLETFPLINNETIYGIMINRKTSKVGITSTETRARPINTIIHSFTMPDIPRTRRVIQGEIKSMLWQYDLFAEAINPKYKGVKK